MHDSSRIGRDNLRVPLESWSVKPPSYALSILTLGVVGQVVDSPCNACHAVGTEIHALFGLSLCAAVLARFRGDKRVAALATPQGMARIARDLSRRIYLLMYVLLGLRMALNIGRPQSLPVEGFRDYLICGILAIVLVRVLAARHVRMAGFTPLASRRRIESL